MLLLDKVQKKNTHTREISSTTNLSEEENIFLLPYEIPSKKKKL